jgi:uncharacterized protein
MPRKYLFMLTAIATALGAANLEAAPEAAFDAFKKNDYATVLRVCEAAAKAGDSICQDMLGVLYSEGKGVARDQAIAFHWFQLAAAQGNPTAAFNLALAYERGEGVATNMAEAEKWYDKAAEAGIPYAQFRLAILAITVHKDAKGGVKWLRPAAAQGLPEAQAMLGFSYERGDGVKKNEKLAAKWYEAAADHGDAQAQSRLAGLYERGAGVDLDFKESYFWYAVALKDPKDPYAKQDSEGLKRVAAKLSAADVADAAKIVHDWKPEEEAVGQKSPRRSTAARGGPKLRATGTGFYVARDGSLLTNNHVVAECSAMRISDGGDGIPAKVIAVDPQRDLALLQAPKPVEAAAVFRADSNKLGENIVVVGFPLTGILSPEPIVTSGIVSALAGAGNNQRQLQISAPIQPGNSGGPVFDASGRIAGIAVGSLDTVRLARAIGVVPENVNFAIKGDEARQFLAAHGVTVATADRGKEFSIAAIAEQAVKMTVRLECWK